MPTLSPDAPVTAVADATKSAASVADTKTTGQKIEDITDPMLLDRMLSHPEEFKAEPEPAGEKTDEETAAEAEQATKDAEEAEAARLAALEKSETPADKRRRERIDHLDIEDQTNLRVALRLVKEDREAGGKLKFDEAYQRVSGGKPSVDVKIAAHAEASKVEAAKDPIAEAEAAIAALEAQLETADPVTDLAGYNKLQREIRKADTALIELRADARVRAAQVGQQRATVEQSAMQQACERWGLLKESEPLALVNARIAELEAADPNDPIFSRPNWPFVVAAMVAADEGWTPAAKGATATATVKTDAVVKLPRQPGQAPVTAPADGSAAGPSAASLASIEKAIAEETDMMKLDELLRAADAIRKSKSSPAPVGKSVIVSRR